MMNSWKGAAAASVLSVSLLTLGVGVPAYAATSAADAKKQQASINSQISGLNNEASELSAQEADLLSRLDEITARKASVDAQMAALQTQIDQNQAELDAAQAQVEEMQRQEEAARVALAEAQTKLDESTAKMKEQAVAAYVGGQSDKSPTEFVLAAEDLRQASAATEYYNQVVDTKRKVVETNRQLRGQAEDLAKQVEDSRTAAEVARNVVASRTAELDAQRISLTGLQAQAQAEVDAQNVVLAEIDSKKDEINQQISDLQAESDKIASLLRSSDSSGTAPTGNGSLGNPVPGARLTSVFGMRTNPVTGKYVLHAGQDFAVAVGTPLQASAAGKVISAGSVSGYGNYTCINHGGGLATCYAHQSQINVVVGQQVNRGQIIGMSGNTGNSTGPHLHFEVRLNGSPVNPTGYL